MLTVTRLVLILGLLAVAVRVENAAAGELTPARARAIAKEAYVYGFPLVDSYRIVHSYFVDRKSPEFRAPFNELFSMARVFTPEDRAVQTPNSDTPYSMLGLDLRTEPIVLAVPAVEAGRYFSLQLIDAYTHNFDYVGTRTTGNDGGTFLVAGPGWKGEAPAGIHKVIRSETEIALVIYRTQLFRPADLDEVKKVQAGYEAKPLSTFLGEAPPPSAPAIDFVAPLTSAEQKTSLRFFDVLSFVLGFCPTHPSERELMARFAEIGIGAGRTLDAAALSPEVRKAITDGMADAWQELATFQKDGIATGKVTSAALFGDREHLRNDYLHRFAAAVLGIYGNSAAEAIYPLYQVDADGHPLDASVRRYTLRFAPDGFPPVNAFWSVTMYALPSQLLVANPIDRYLINSPMLGDLRRDADGGVTIHVQSESPGKEREPNWLPAPKGPFVMAMRLYWPKPEALDGTWTAPKLGPHVDRGG